MLSLVRDTVKGSRGDSTPEQIVLTGLELVEEGNSLGRLCICTSDQNGAAFLLRKDEIEDDRTALCPRCQKVHALIRFRDAVVWGGLNVEEGVYCVPAALLLSAF